MKIKQKLGKVSYLFFFFFSINDFTDNYGLLALQLISSPELIFCVDSYSVSVPITAVARKRPRSFCQKCRLQVTSKHAITLDITQSESADYA